MSNALQIAQEIIRDVKERGLAAALEHAVRLGDLKPGEPYWFAPTELERAFVSLTQDEQELLLRAAKRIRCFAEAQRACLSDLTVVIPGGMAGHTAAPVENVGCYAPGGRYALPSSVLMAAIPARVAGVNHIIVASPRPNAMTLAAAFVAGADGLLAIGGAQAIAAMAFGVGDILSRDMIVGPGNRYVTAAKQLLVGQVGIDMLAGPSELVVVADKSANPEWIAADLLAQAEHDADATPILIALNETLMDQVAEAIDKQLQTLPTRNVAEQSLQNGYLVLAKSIDEAASICNQLAPEHLQLMIDDAANASGRFKQYGALFIGSNSAEVFGDYGFGPNHTLPTNGSARFSGGLSVLSFLRTRTWMRIDNVSVADEAIADCTSLARVEGLEAHARAARLRRKTSQPNIGQSSDNTIFSNRVNN